MSARLAEHCAVIAEVMGSNPVKAWILFFFFFSGLIFTTAHVVFITAKFAFIPDRREMANSVMWELHRKSHESVQIHLLQTFFRLSEYFKCRLPDLRNIFKFRVCVSTYEFCEVSGSGKQRMKATGGFWVFNDNSRKRKKKKTQTNKQTDRCFCDHVGLCNPLEN